MVKVRNKGVGAHKNYCLYYSIAHIEAARRLAQTRGVAMSKIIEEGLENLEELKADKEFSLFLEARKIIGE